MSQPVSVVVLALSVAINMCACEVVCISKCFESELMSTFSFDLIINQS